MIVGLTSIHLEFTEHGTAKRSLRKHTANGSFDDLFRLALLQLVERSFLNATWEASVVIVLLIKRLVAGNLNLRGVDYDYVITGI